MSGLISRLPALAVGKKHLSSCRFLIQIAVNFYQSQKFLLYLYHQKLPVFA
jgi:hypothetical protein